jgi:hypothetical protein
MPHRIKWKWLLAPSTWTDPAASAPHGSLYASTPYSVTRMGLELKLLYTSFMYAAMNDFPRSGSCTDHTLSDLATESCGPHVVAGSPSESIVVHGRGTTPAERCGFAAFSHAPSTHLTKLCQLAPMPSQKPLPGRLSSLPKPVRRTGSGTQPRDDLAH